MGRVRSRSIFAPEWNWGSCTLGACRPSMVDISWITPDLAVGACFPDDAIDEVAHEYRIRAVVDLRAESHAGEIELADHGIELLHLPTLDHASVAPEMLRAGVGFAARHLDAGERVLLHCQHGVGRSGLLALCVLVQQGYSPLEALQLAKSRRNKVSPSPKQFDTWADWLRRRGEEVPSFDEFARIAYRHQRL
jgi:predicted protein tyrosine phosphatase